VPGPAVNHARSYGHFSEKQLLEMEKALSLYSHNHLKEVQSFKDFRRTLPSDPGTWNDKERKRFDERYKTNVDKVKENTAKSRGVAKNWKIPPHDVHSRPVTWVLDKEHLGFISEHLWNLAQKGEWSEENREAFKKDLDEYVKLEQQELDRKATLHKAAMEKWEADKAAGKRSPRQKGPPKRDISAESRKAKALRDNLERAVFSHRWKAEL